MLRIKMVMAVKVESSALENREVYFQYGGGGGGSRVRWTGKQK